MVDVDRVKTVVIVVVVVRGVADMLLRNLESAGQRLSQVWRRISRGS